MDRPLRPAAPTSGADPTCSRLTISTTIADANARRGIAGCYADFSVFDVPDHDALHEILSTLLLFPFMTIKATPLVRHPSVFG